MQSPPCLGDNRVLGIDRWKARANHSVCSKKTPLRARGLQAAAPSSMTKGGKTSAQGAVCPALGTTPSLRVSGGVQAGSLLLSSRRRRPSEGLAHALPGAVPAVQAAHQTATRSLRLAAQLRKSGAVGTPRPSPHPGLRFPTRQALSDRHRPRRLALELRGCWLAATACATYPLCLGDH